MSKSKRKRGTYRGIFSALIDDPDFQKLSAEARLTLLIARQCHDAGPSAIFRYYPEKLARQTGLPVGSLVMALAELAAGGWIEEDGDLLWVRNGLRYDPHISLANLHHRESITDHLHSLPKRPIVLRFCDYYQLDYPFTSDATSHRLPTLIREPEEGTGVGNLNLNLNGNLIPTQADAWSSPQRAKTGPTWEAYSRAYAERYKAPPVRNAKINGMLTYFLQRIPREEGPAVAEHYVRSNFRLYVSAMHPVDLLLRDAEKLRTEWATGRSMTEVQAREADRRKGAGEHYREAIDELEREDKS